MTSKSVLKRIAAQTGQEYQTSTVPAAMRLHRLGSLLGRWHQWRKHFRVENGISTPPERRAARDPDEVLEDLLMRTIDSEVSALPAANQLALQHIARAECLGVEITSPQLPASPIARESLYSEAMRHIELRLIRAGLL